MKKPFYFLLVFFFLIIILFFILHKDLKQIKINNTIIRQQKQIIHNQNMLYLTLNNIYPVKLTPVLPYKRSHNNEIYNNNAKAIKKKIPRR